MAFTYHNYQHAAAVLGTDAQPQIITCIILKIGYLWVRLAAENPAFRAVLSPQVTVEEPGMRRIAVSPENRPISLSRRQQPEAGARVGTGHPALAEALRLTFQLAAQVAIRITTQTTAETGPQVKPRDAPQQTFQVPSSEALPVSTRLNVHVPVEFGSPIATRDPADFAARFAPQVAPRTTARTTPGTVPGTVPKVTREASFPAISKSMIMLTRCEIASYGNGSK